MAEKPLAMDLPALEKLFHAAQKTKVALVPMHTMRGVPALAAVKQAVAAGANAYYDFAGAVTAKGRVAPKGIDTAIPDPSTPSTDSLGQKWIGGTVLYVEQEKTP